MHTPEQRLPRHSSRQSAFTLIELLVVITIIGILAGLLLPVTSSVMKTARKTSARATEQQIVAAVNNYKTEYGAYPVPVTQGSAATNDYTYTADASGGNNNGQLFDVLRALNDTTSPDTPTGSLNTRKVIYFEAKNVKNVTVPKDGFVAIQAASGNAGVSLNIGDLVDPFGNLFGVRIDANYTGAIKNPYAESGKDASDDVSTPANSQDQSILRTGVVAFSYGVDGKIGDNGNAGSTPYTPTPGDDVVSWQ